MKNTSLAFQTEQFTEALWRLFRVKQRLTALLPEELMQLKARLGEWQPESGGRRLADFGFIYRLGVVLSRQKGPMTMGELSEASGVPPSTATRMVDWLVENGYAERLSDPEDRRIVRVRLTEAGRALYRTIDEFIHQRIAQILRQFTDEERQDILRLLGKLAETLDGAAK